MICKKCLHFEACKGILAALGYVVDEARGGNATKCVTFTPKSQYAEVKHGEWIVEEFPAEVGAKKVCCSNCGHFEYKGELWDVKEDAHSYCPNCGADMRGNNG